MATPQALATLQAPEGVVQSSQAVGEPLPPPCHFECMDLELQRSRGPPGLRSLRGKKLIHNGLQPCLNSPFSIATITCSVSMYSNPVTSEEDGLAPGSIIASFVHSVPRCFAGFYVPAAVTSGDVGSAALCPGAKFAIGVAFIGYYSL